MRKIVSGILSVLLLASLLCGCAAEETSSPQTDTEATSAPESTAATSGADDKAEPAAAIDAGETAAAEDGEDEASNADFLVDWTLNGAWEDNGKQCGTYEAVITNNSSQAISSWTVELSVPQGFEITASWNGVFSLTDNTLTIENESYNGEIAAGSTAGFGFNYACDGDFTPENVTVNGEAASNSAAATADGSDSPAETAAVSAASTIPPAPEDPEGSTPVATHGQLSVEGTQLVDENGDAYQLTGMSTHGITWFPDFVNEDAFRTLRDDWNTNVVRLAMYVDEYGNESCYMQNRDGSLQLLEKGVDICIELGMYVIIDWHVLNPGDPSAYTDEAIEFFSYISEKYADYPNVLYEIVNEPNGSADWSGVIKPYAEEIIPVIRANDEDAVIIVGTPTWSQDIDEALADPLEYDNIMYALHFYAATHTDWLRERMETCINAGLPVFVSEFGCCDASGGGSNDFTQTEAWLELLDEYGVSYCNWSLCNKDETCSALKPTASADGSWSEDDYSESGAWIRSWFINH